MGVNTTGFPITSHSSVTLSDGSYPQQSPKVRFSSNRENVMLLEKYTALYFPSSLYSLNVPYNMQTEEV
jgi:hypothetical protein